MNRDEDEGSSAKGAEFAERTLDDAATITQLAALPPLEYERERESAAERMGCRVSILDRLVAAARGGDAGPGQGRALDLRAPEPWPEPVDGAALLNGIVTEIRRYVVFGAPAADAVALWAAATHDFNRFVIFPRLLINAPEKGCGKTTLLDAISRLVPRPLPADNITAAALFRTIEAARPTLLLDEADTYLRDNEDLRGLLDSGHRRDGSVIRTVGDTFEPRRFSTFAPVALAAIGRLPGTIEDRSIKIEMRRRRPDEHVIALRLDRTGKLDELARRAARWALDHAEALGEADPEMPAGIYNRMADNWRPAFAVADLAGGQWPDRARWAAVELIGDGEDTASAKVLLLADLRELFTHEPSAVLFTREILDILHKDETRPWPEWKNGRPITDRQLAALLKEHKIKPKTVRRGDVTEKGYKLEWFEDVFARYLQPPSVTASQTSDSGGFDPLRSVTPETDMTPDVMDKYGQTPRDSTDCDAVTDAEQVCNDEELEWRG
jgi:putative DNA primase/helicase